jgi:hypothetical protein
MFDCITMDVIGDAYHIAANYLKKTGRISCAGLTNLSPSFGNVSVTLACARFTTMTHQRLGAPSA